MPELGVRRSVGTTNAQRAYYGGGDDEDGVTMGCGDDNDDCVIVIIRQLGGGMLSTGIGLSRSARCASRFVSCVVLLTWVMLGATTSMQCRALVWYGGASLVYYC